MVKIIKVGCFSIAPFFQEATFTRCRFRAIPLKFFILPLRGFIHLSCFSLFCEVMQETSVFVEHVEPSGSVGDTRSSIGCNAPTEPNQPHAHLYGLSVRRLLAMAAQLQRRTRLQHPTKVLFSLNMLKHHLST